VLTCFSLGRSDYSVERLHIGIFTHTRKLGPVVLTLLSSCGAYARYSVCHPTGCLFGVMYIRFCYDDMCTGCSCDDYFYVLIFSLFFKMLLSKYFKF
jgi:hypothetical protein